MANAAAIAPRHPPKELLQTQLSLIQTFSEFLIIAIHTILYERALYPASTFVSARAYNFPVRQNLHPEVSQWIKTAVANVEDQMIKGTVALVAVVIYSRDEKVMERFMFDVSGFPQVGAKERLTPFAPREKVEGEEKGKERENTAEDMREGLQRRRLKRDIVAADVEEQLRAAIRMLVYRVSKLGDLPEECTFTVSIDLKDEAEPPIGHPQPWIPSVPSLQTGDKGDSQSIGRDLGGAKSRPVRLVEAGEFRLNTWIEECEAKDREPASTNYGTQDSSWYD